MNSVFGSSTLSFFCATLTAGSIVHHSLSSSLLAQEMRSCEAVRLSFGHNHLSKFH